jgi:RNA polymerase sigma-70 factor (ECF subfamily)
MGESTVFENTLLLVDRAREGEAAALGELVERYRDRLLGRIRLMLGEEARRRADSVDFLQGAFLEFLVDGGVDPVHDERALMARLTAIARNNVRDAVRRPRERAFQSLSASLAGSLPRGAGATPTAEVVRREELMELAEALERLPEDYRTVIELRDLEGLDYAAVGAGMSRSADAAQMLHTRALVKLGTLLADG